MTKVMIVYTDNTEADTNIYQTVEVEPGTMKDCPKLLAINSFDLDWYATRTIIDVKVL